MLHEVFKLNLGQLVYNLWEFKVYIRGIMEQNILRNTPVPSKMLEVFKAIFYIKWITRYII